MNAWRNDGAESTVSALALMVLYATFGSLAQFGIRPHRKLSKVRCLVSGLNRIARTSCIGAMFQLIGRSPLRRYWNVIPACKLFSEVVRLYRPHIGSDPLPRSNAFHKS